MPSGIDQPGGPGTRIFVYDNSSPWLDAAMTQPRSPGPYSFQEILFACLFFAVPSPQDFESLVGQVSGTGFLGRSQYISHVPVRIGGTDADGTAPTTIQDIDVDVYFEGTTTLEYRTVGYSNSLLATNFGTRRAVEFGSYKDIAGSNGVILITSNTTIFRGNMSIYGSYIGTTTGGIQFLDSGGTNVEVCGNIIAPNAACTLGNSSSPQLMAQNNAIITGLGVTPLAAMSVLDANGTFISGSGMGQFLSSGTANLRLNGIKFIGQPTLSDLRWLNTGGTNWNLIQLGWSQTSGKPKFSGTPVIALANSAKEWRYFNTKVCDTNGAPIADIPISLESDIDGVIVDTKTFGDGDIGFTNGALSGVSNMVLVQDHYNPAANSYTTRNRVFTLTVNGNTGSFVSNTSYPRVILRFEWPGRDVFRGTFTESGGIFTDCIVPVTLGTIGASFSPWNECNLP